MDGNTKVLLVAASLAAGGLALCLAVKWMERRGWVNLRVAGGGLAAGATAVREFVDPPAKHVRQVREYDRTSGDPGGPPDPTRSARPAGPPPGP